MTDATFDSNDVYNRGFTELVSRRVVQGYGTHTECTERCIASPSHDLHLRKLKGLRNQWFSIDN